MKVRVSVWKDIDRAGGGGKRDMVDYMSRWGNGRGGEEDGGKFGNEVLDFGYGVRQFWARVWVVSGLEGKMEEGGRGGRGALV